MKLIAVDLDGTLLRCEGAVSVAVVGAVRGVVPAAAFAVETIDGFGQGPNYITQPQRRGWRAMLTWASTSYAMANAHPDVLAAADYVAPSNDYVQGRCVSPGHRREGHFA